MLINLDSPTWWYMEIPRTGTTTLTKVLRNRFSAACAPYAKHWPILPPQSFLASKPLSLVSVRNPYSRAVSCWQFFTVPGSISFLDWTFQRLKCGFFDVQIEARPQSFWYDLCQWDHVIRQEHINEDFQKFLAGLGDSVKQITLPVLNATNSEWTNRLNKKTSRDRPWQEYYCDKAKENVLELYQADFSSLSTYYSTSFPDCLDKNSEVRV